MAMPFAILTDSCNCDKVRFIHPSNQILYTLFPSASECWPYCKARLRFMEIFPFRIKFQCHNIAIFPMDKRKAPTHSTTGDSRFKRFRGDPYTWDSLRIVLISVKHQQIHAHICEYKESMHCSLRSIYRQMGEFKPSRPYIQVYSHTCKKNWRIT